MKRLFRNLMLLSLSAVLFTVTGQTADAEIYPATPQDVEIEVEVNEDAEPITGDIKLSWDEGEDYTGEKGDVFRIYRVFAKSGMAKKELVAEVEKEEDHEGSYSYTLEDQRAGLHCFVIDDYNSEHDIAGDHSDKVCSKIQGEGDDDHAEDKLKFDEDHDYVRVASGEEGRYEIEVENETDCEYRIEVAETNLETFELDGNILTFSGDDGKYLVLLTLYNGCNDEPVDKMALKVCIGECEEDDDDGDDESGIKLVKDTELHHKVEVGAEFRYQLSATSTDGCDVHYELAGDDTHKGIKFNIPEELTVDKETGEIVWEETEEGKYLIPIRLYSSCDSTTSRMLVLKLEVGNGDDDHAEKHELKVNLYTETDDIEEFNGFVIIYSTDRSHKRDHKVRKVRVKDNDEVEVKLPEGKYIVQAVIHGYQPEFYEDARILPEATVLEINSETEISIMLDAAREPELYTVSGQVTDEATGEPLKAVVKFVPVKWQLGGKGKSDMDMSIFSDLRVETDEEGRYEIKLPDLFNYYAKASAHHKDNNDRKYMDQYYEMADTYFEADIISLMDTQEDITGIDFKMKYKETEEKSGFTGQVVDEEGNPVMSKLIAIKLRDDDKRHPFKSMTRTDDEGYYGFDDLKYGEYILLSIPVNSNYLPGYFVMGDVVTRRWKEATRIEVGEVMPTVLFTVTHEEVETDDLRSGLARIIGFVREKYTGLAPGEEPTNEALNGTMIYAENEEGKTVNHYFTDVNGYFELSGLEPGVYTLHTDKVGFEAYSETIEVDYTEKTDVVTEIELSALSPTKVDYSDFDSAELTVSPMPVTDKAVVKFNSSGGNALVKLVDMSGNIVYQKQLQTSVGHTEFEIKATDLSAGAYILIIDNRVNAISGTINILK